jgi:hypothetical protein
LLLILALLMLAEVWTVLMTALKDPQAPIAASRVLPHERLTAASTAAAATATATAVSSSAVHAVDLALRKEVSHIMQQLQQHTTASATAANAEHSSSAAADKAVVAKACATVRRCVLR